MQSTLLGISMMIVATSMISIGAVLQKKAVDRLPAFESQPVATSVLALIRSPVWVLGWLLGSSAVLLNMIALGLADISVIQPLNGFGLVVLAIASRLVLGERLNPRATGGIATIIAGVALIGVVAPPSRDFSSAGEILGSFTHQRGVLTLAGLTTAVVLVTLLTRTATRLAGVLFGFVGAACSVIGFTLAKGVFGVVHVAGVGPALLSWPVWALAVTLLAFKVAAMVYQQLSFQKGRAVVVTSVFAATSVALPLLPGRMVFDEPVSGLMLPATLLIVLGVILLSAGRGEAEEPVPRSVQNPPGPV